MRLPIQVEGVLYRRNKDRLEYLLLKRLPQRNGFWQPVTGGVEEGETLEQALRREVMEETGVENVESITECLLSFEFACPIPNTEYVFGVEISPDDHILLDGKEHSEYRWCGLDEALGLLYWNENKEALRRLDSRLNSRTMKG